MFNLNLSYKKDGRVLNNFVIKSSFMYIPYGISAYDEQKMKQKKGGASTSTSSFQPPGQSSGMPP